MKITLVAQDTAPSQALEKLTAALALRGHDFAALLGKDSVFQPDELLVDAWIKNSQAVVVGMSSSVELAKDEIYALKLAKQYEIPAFCYADTFGVHNRPWFQELLPGCTLFHISADEVDKALKVLPKTRIRFVGNPMWEGFFFPKLTRAEAREKLNLNELRKVILCPGGKNAEVNALHFARAAELCSQLQDVVIFLSLHPGDKTDQVIYQKIIDEASVPMRILCKETLTASDALPGTDLVIESASTIGIEAVCQRIPVVDYFSDIARERLKMATGSDQWPLCNQVAFDLDVFKGCENQLIKDLLYSGANKEHFIRNAKKFYPVPEKKGAAIERMVRDIEEIVWLNQ